MQPQGAPAWIHLFCTLPGSWLRYRHEQAQTQRLCAVEHSPRSWHLSGMCLGRMKDQWIWYYIPELWYRQLVLHCLKLLEKYMNGNEQRHVEHAKNWCSQFYCPIKHSKQTLAVLNLLAKFWACLTRKVLWPCKSGRAYQGLVQQAQKPN